MRTFSDDHIERQAALFHALGLQRDGCTFEAFLCSPEHCLRRYRFTVTFEPDGALPLLDAQAAVARRIEQSVLVEEAVARVNGERWAA